MGYQLLLYCFITLVEPAIYYVDSEASSGGDGSSWFSAYRHLQAALDAASGNDRIYLMGNRTYIPRTLKRDNCFVAPQDIFIFGGFRSDSETQPSDRPAYSPKTDLYESIISGNINNQATNLDNCYHVLTYTKTLTLNRVSIIQGNADDEYSGPETRALLNGFGAALITNDILQTGQFIVITDTIFRDNQALAGGALFFGSSKNSLFLNNDVTVKIIGSMFDANKALNGRFEGGYGGAIYAYHNVIITIQNTLFQYNYAEFRAGALYQDYGGDFTCTDCIFYGNVAGAYGGALFSENRYMVAPSTVARIQGSAAKTLFDSNSAIVFGGGLVFLNEVTAGLQQVDFNKNLAAGDDEVGAAGSGGAKAVFWSTVIEDTVTYTGNTPTPYEEVSEPLFTGVDDNLDEDLQAIMAAIWDLYTRKGEQIDVFPDTIIGSQICYVDINNANSNSQTGESWTNAYSDLQDCLDKLQNNGGEVWVAGRGENNAYIPSTVPAIKPGNSDLDIDKSFQMYDNVHVYGGFSGDETERKERNFYDNPTYLSGEINSNQLVNNIIIAADATVIDGFYIVNAGCSSDFRTEPHVGGGIYADSVEFNVVNSIFYKLCANRNGGAIHCYGTVNGEDIEPIIRNVMFIGNRASYDGGAIYGIYQCNIQCKWCDFDQNSVSRRGGAVYLTFNSDVYFESSKFTNNYALDSGGCVGVEELSNATFYCGKFFNNSARWEGGCLYAGSGIDIQKHDDEHFQGFIDYGSSFDNVFEDNFLFNAPAGGSQTGFYDKGQPDVYLWPYTDFIFYPEDCGGQGVKPTPPPTFPPVAPTPMTCWDTSIGEYKNEALDIELILSQREDVIIRSCLSSFNTRLDLLDNSGGIIASDSDSCETNDNAEITRNGLDADTYIIRLDADESISYGLYHIIIVCPARTTPPPPPYYDCSQHKPVCGDFDGTDIQFEFRQTLGRKTKVIFSACQSNFDTRLTLKDNGDIIDECDDCGEDNEPGDCGFCCHGENALASQLEQDLNRGTYFLTLTSGATGPVVGRYCIEFICLPITPEPTPRTRPPSRDTSPPSTPDTLVPSTPSPDTPPPTGPGRLCCEDTARGEYNNIDIWMRFDLDQDADTVIFTSCDSEFDTYIEIWDVDRQFIIEEASNGCEAVDFNQAMLTMTEVPRESYYIKLRHEGAEVSEENNRFVFGIICITPPPTPIITPPPSPTIFPPTPTAPTTTFEPTKPCENVIQCFDTILGTYNNGPIEFEFDFIGEYKNIEIDTCGSKFDTRLTILDDTLSEVIVGCSNTNDAQCTCDNCGDLDTVVGDCIFPAPCCATITPDFSAFEPLNAALQYIDFPIGKYYIVLDTPTFGPVIADYRIYSECSGQVSGIPTPSPGGPPTEVGKIDCDSEAIFGPFDDQDVNMKFTLGDEYIEARVEFNACASDFDTLLQLWDEDFQQLIAEDDNGCGLVSLQSHLILNTLSPGDYYLVLSSGAGGEETRGWFDISIACIPIGTRSPGPSPTPEPPINCETPPIVGFWQGNKLEFEFDLFQPVIATLDTCFTSFNTKVELRNGDLTEIIDECNNCGTFQIPGDCSTKVDDPPGYVCCEGIQGNGEFKSELTRVMTPGRYYWTVDYGLFPPPIDSRYEVRLTCIPSPPSEEPTFPPFTMRPTPRPTAMTPRPTLRPVTVPVRWPTPRPVLTWPTPYEAPKDQCTDRCDAFSVSVVDYYYSSDYSSDNICIRYNVKRVVSSGYYCYRPIRYVVLGLCNGDSINDNSNSGCSDTDLNGLLESFTVISGDDESMDRRRLGGRGYSTSCFGTNSDGLYGIMVNIEIETELTFEICLRNVFTTGSNIQFSDNVRFRRGYNKFTCNDNWVIGLPCIDSNKFTAGGTNAYKNSGFNTNGNRYGKYYKKRKNRRNRAENEGISLIDNTDLQAANPIVRWEVLSCLLLFSLCAVGICTYCLILRKKKKKLMKQERGERVKSYEYDNENENENENEMSENENNSLQGNNNEKTKIFQRTKKYQNINTTDEIEMENITQN